MGSDSSVKFLYKTVPGRMCLQAILKLRLYRVITKFLCSGHSKPLAHWYIKNCGIEVTPEEKASFRSFREMFARTRSDIDADLTPGHLISPCDGCLSVFPINEDSSFELKNSRYKIKDFLQDDALAEKYIGGTCLIFRLCVSDYHHYCYIDDGYQEKNHFIPGVLHSVQPIACETYPVFLLNKRSWCLLSTEHFGDVVQCEIGALVVGGIANEKECGPFGKGDEKGHFELAGSTIVLLLEQGQIELLPEITEKLRHSEECRVRQGQWIGTAKDNR